jgi:pimeloyl-ACP methyl ester carboxylesterase
MNLYFDRKEVLIDHKAMAYYEKGSGSVTCLFSCGWAVPFPLSDMFELADAMSLSCRCIVIDRFGYGYSDSVDSNRTFSEITSETKLLIDSLEITGDIVFVGHSLATFHALDFANRFPQLIKGVVIIDSYFNGFDGESLFKFNWIRVYYHLLLQKLGVFRRASDGKLTKILFGDRIIPENIVADSLIAFRKGIYNKVVRSELKWSIKDLKHIYDNMKNLKNIPVVSICRNITYRSNKIYGDYIPNYKLVNVGESTHFIHHIHLQKVIDEITELCI